MTALTGLRLYVNVAGRDWLELAPLRISLLYGTRGLSFWSDTMRVIVVVMMMQLIQNRYSQKSIIFMVR